MLILSSHLVVTITILVTGEGGSLETNMAGVISQHQHSSSFAAANTASAAAGAASAALESQLHAAEQQMHELQSQLHHKDMRVANAEAAQRSAESKRDAVVQEHAKLEEQLLRHQQVETTAKCDYAQLVSHAFSCNSSNLGIHQSSVVPSG